MKLVNSTAMTKAFYAFIAQSLYQITKIKANSANHSAKRKKTMTKTNFKKWTDLTPEERE